MTQRIKLFYPVVLVVTLALSGVQSAWATAIAISDGRADVELVEILDSAGAIVNPRPDSLFLAGVTSEDQNQSQDGNSGVDNSAGTGVQINAVDAGDLQLGEGASAHSVSQAFATPVGSAAGDQTFVWEIQMFNATTEDFTINFVVDWAVAAATSIDDLATESAAALTTVSIDLLAGNQFQQDAGVDSTVNAGSVIDLADSLIVSVFLGAGASEILSASVFTSAFAVAEEAVAIPEPGILLLFSLGLLVLSVRRIRTS